jgi:aminoglycoside phosphotransferase (APT) family kinase protein
MGELHAQLHSLPIDPALVPPLPFLARRLDEISSLIDTYALKNLQPGLDWLQCHRLPEFPHASWVHLDWHPLNLVEGPDSSLGAVDWSEADIGDPHADVAMTQLLLRLGPSGGLALYPRLGVAIGRPIVALRYLQAYRRLRGLDRERLYYYQAWAALRRLACYGRWLRAGPQANGCKPSLLRHLHPRDFRALAQWFRKRTGVCVGLGESGAGLVE